MIVGFDPLQWIVDRLNEALAGFTGPIANLFRFVSSTPLDLTSQNAIIQHMWTTLTAAADLLFVLAVIVGAIQMMYGQSTGSFNMSPGQFIGKAIVTGILIHMSAAFGEFLLVLNNAFCSIVQANIQDFIRQTNNGQLLTNRQILVVSIVLTIVFGFTLLRIIFQAIKRIVRFNVLFVLSGLAFLSTFHPDTSTIFSIWLRMFLSTIFEQFLQFLAFGLGLQFLIAAHLQGLGGFILAVAILGFTAEVPGLLSRFSAVASSNRTGFGALVSTSIRASALFV